MSSVDASATPRSAPSVGSLHQVRVDSLELGWITREMIRARIRSRWRPAGPSRAGSPSLAAIACTAAACPCGTERVMVTAPAAATKLLAFQAGVDQVQRIRSPATLAYVGRASLVPGHCAYQVQCKRVLEVSPVVIRASATGASVAAVPPLVFARVLGQWREEPQTGGIGTGEVLLAGVLRVTAAVSPGKGRRRQPIPLDAATGAGSRGRRQALERCLSLHPCLGC